MCQAPKIKFSSGPGEHHGTQPGERSQPEGAGRLDVRGLLPDDY